MKSLVKTIVAVACGCTLLSGCGRAPSPPKPDLFAPAGITNWRPSAESPNPMPGIDQASVYFMGTVFVIWGDFPDGDGGDPKSYGDGGRDGSECRGHLGSHKGRKVEFHCKTKVRARRITSLTG